MFLHSAIPEGVQAAMDALPHDAHPMSVLLTGLSALGGVHPEANPAIVGQNVYKDAVTRDKNIVRLIGKIPGLAAAAYHKHTGRKAAHPGAHMTYAESFLYQLDGSLHPEHKPNPKCGASRIPCPRMRWLLSLCCSSSVSYSSAWGCCVTRL